MNSPPSRTARLAKLAKTRLRLNRRRLRRILRRTRATASMRAFRAQLTTAKWAIRTFLHVNAWATVLSLAIFVLFIAVFPTPKSEKVSEVALTCAQVIGAALALVLSLSIIPAQRAAEAFSPAVLKLYAQDRWLLAAFLALVLTTAASVLLGTNLATLDSRVLLGAQFALLGISFDALRLFHARTLDLLIPQTAVRLVVAECTEQLRNVSRIVDRVVRIQALAAADTHSPEVSRWLLFSGSQVTASLRFWTGQLDEIAHKLVSRRDTSAVNDIVSAMGMIGRQYADARRSSLILVPDSTFPLAGGLSDIQDVLNPIYENIRVICEDAAKASKSPSEKFGFMTRHLRQAA